MVPEREDTPQVFIVDDEAPFREDIAEILGDEGFRCRTAGSAEDALSAIRSDPPDVVLSDIVMPGMNGVELLKRLQEICPETGVFMATAYGNLDTAVEAFREGAYDYLAKPVNPDEVIEKIRRFLEFQEMANELDRLRRKISQSGVDRGHLQLVGDSEPMQEVYDLIDRAGATSSNVLVTGESGTGKELVARSIHGAQSEERDEEIPFVAVNCASLSENLLESELFGYVKGAFTGATQDKEGYFQAADGGVLFLDEISEIDVDLQAKLLRAIENKEIQRVGSTESIPVDVRVIASSNRDLKGEVEDGRFREDLYYRLNVLHVTLPTLKERREDIPLLLDYFLKKFNRDMNRDVLLAENAAIQSLMAYDWPGNVRELENVVERWMIVSEDEDEVLQKQDLPPDIRGSSSDEQDLSGSLKEAVNAYEKQHIRQTLQSMDGNKKATAEKLGIDPSTLYRKMDKYGLSD